LLPPSVALTTAGIGQADSGSPTSFAGNFGTFWGEGGSAPTPKILDDDYYLDVSGVASASPSSGSPKIQSRIGSPKIQSRIGSPKIQSRIGSPLRTLPDRSPNSPPQDAADPSDLGIDIDMSDATDASSAGGNPGEQTSPGSPAQHTAGHSGFGIDMPNIADTADTADIAGAASAGGGPEIQSRVSNPPSSPAQHAADPPGLVVDMPDTTDAVSASKPIIVDVDALELQKPRSILTMPNFKGPYSKRLNEMIEWGHKQFPKNGLNEFKDGKFIRAGVFHELSSEHSWLVIEHSPTHPLSKAGMSKTNPSKS
ncbi:hypothetical protein GGTG_14188, partial [Gaeumannomyces tritici R3-111a-1]